MTAIIDEVIQYIKSNGATVVANEVCNGGAQSVLTFMQTIYPQLYPIGIKRSLSYAFNELGVEVDPVTNEFRDTIKNRTSKEFKMPTMPITQAKKKNTIFK